MGFLESLWKVMGAVFGTRNERVLKVMAPIVEQINSLEDKMKALTDAEMAEMTMKFRKMYQEEMGDLLTPPADESFDEMVETRKRRKARQEEILEMLLPEAFALVREAGRRFMNPSMRHFDVQLIGGMVLHRGGIAEMITGEGKTLVATLPAYLNAITGRGVHVVTVNDYLARRDSEWMAPIYRGLGLTVGAIQADMSNEERQPIYAGDITYGTNNEFGFDYLRDNMKISIEDLVQRELHFAIVDEVDSILIDEARTPLIISGSSEKSTEVYYNVNKLGRLLKEKEDFELNEKDHSVGLTEKGISKAEHLLNMGDLFSGKNIELPHYIDNALRAWHLYKLDRDYVVKDGEIIIVDEFTGRLMPGRRWSDGLHQAVEAKENLRIKEENQTLATITLQNYFLLYDKLAGMTGTALTEAGEFLSIYKLDVTCIPPNRVLQRTNFPDVIYGTDQEKYDAILDEIKFYHEKGRPVLVGTTSIEKSERISNMLTPTGIQHEVLNAKHHEREAEIVSKAGQHGRVTVATNMAGRGTDIILGDGVAALGGLHVVGTERHEARRIDNQLRGRCGRQGDPGSSRFFLSLEDDLVRVFASEWVANFLRRYGLSEGQPIESTLVSRSIEKAQKRVEERHYEMRKSLLDYDKVMDDQRRIIYSQRHEILKGYGTRETVLKMFEEMIGRAVDTHIASGYEPEQDVETAATEHLEVTAEDRSHWDFAGFADDLKRKYGPDVIPEDLRTLERDDLIRQCVSLAEKIKEEKIKAYGITWDFEGLQLWAKHKLAVILTPQICQEKSPEELAEFLYAEAVKLYEQKEKRVGDDNMRLLERYLLLQIMDAKWKDHLYAMDHLRDSVGFRGYGGKDPKVEYKKEGFAMFSQMIDKISEEVSHLILRVEFADRSEVEVRDQYGPAVASKQDFGGYKGDEGEGVSNEPLRPYVRTEDRIGRNDPCPCGSGKKYKKCCGADAK